MTMMKTKIEKECPRRVHDEKDFKKFPDNSSCFATLRQKFWPTKFQATIWSCTVYGRVVLP